MRLLGVVLTVVLVAPVAHSSDEDAVASCLDSVRRLYERLEYEQALEQLADVKELVRAAEDAIALALFEGIILAELGRDEEAVIAFKEGLLLRPVARLPVRVSPKIEQLLEQARQEVKREVGF